MDTNKHIWIWIIIVVVSISFISYKYAKIEGKEIKTFGAECFCPEGYREIESQKGGRVISCIKFIPRENVEGIKYYTINVQDASCHQVIKK